jgi:two-component system LytT family response regulator
MKKIIPNFCQITRAKIHFTRTRKIIPLQDIIMLQGEVNYTLLYLLSGRKVLIPRTLKLFESILENYNFLRTHRGFIINCEHLQSVDNHGLLMCMTNNLQASVSRRRRESVNEKLHFQA